MRRQGERGQRGPARASSARLTFAWNQAWSVSGPGQLAQTEHLIPWPQPGEVCATSPHGFSHRSRVPPLLTCHECFGYEACPVSPRPTQPCPVQSTVIGRWTLRQVLIRIRAVGISGSDVAQVHLLPNELRPPWWSGNRHALSNTVIYRVVTRTAGLSPKGSLTPLSRGP